MIISESMDLNELANVSPKDLTPFQVESMRHLLSAFFDGQEVVDISKDDMEWMLFRARKSAESHYA